MKKSKLIFSTIAALMLVSGCQGETNSSLNSSLNSIEESSSIVSSVVSSSSELSVSTSESSSINESLSSSESSSITESSSSEESSVDLELESAREKARNYINSIDLNLYREAERNNISEAIRKALQAIESEDATVESIESTIQSLKTYVESQKTDAQYVEEEQQAYEAELKRVKEEKLEEIKVADLYQYREEEISTINADYSELVTLINEAKSIVDVTNINTGAFINKLHTLKTNASYTMDEMIKYPDVSEWPLVTEHNSMWTRTESGINTNSIAYLLDSGNTYNDVKFSFTVNANVDVGIAGVLKVQQNPTGDGLDGYLINIVSNSTSQFVQVYYLNNCYCSVGPVVCDYIGGWVYPGRVLGTSFRISFEGSNCIIMDENEYMTLGNNATAITVDLTKQGQYPLVPSGELGIINWDGTNIDISLDKIVTDEANVISSKSTLTKFVNDYLSTVDVSKYRAAEQEIINGLINDITSSISGDSVIYSEVTAKLDAMKETIKALKTDAQYTDEENASNLTFIKNEKKNLLRAYVVNSYGDDSADAINQILAEADQAIDSCTTIDQINAFDLSSYRTRLDAVPSYASELCNSIINDPTQSDWPLVTEHSATWTYSSERPNQVETNQVAWQLNKKDYSDFDLVFGINSDADLGINGIGMLCRITKATGNDGINGYLINLVSNGGNQFVQVWYLENAYGTGAPNMAYMGGWIYPGVVKNTMFRIRFDGSSVHIFDENAYISGDKNPSSTVDLTQGGTRTLYQSGKIGIVNWDGTNSTFMIRKLQEIIK